MPADERAEGVLVSLPQSGKESLLVTLRRRGARTDHAETVAVTPGRVASLLRR
jgi:hypothetical protein